ncbi:MAG: hypothetical protein WC551_13670 [Patescibacteria group bacterium]
MKSRMISMRVEEGKRRRWGKAAREHKNLSAFFDYAVGKYMKCRRLIEQVERIERRCARRNEKMPRMRVVEG